MLPTPRPAPGSRPNWVPNANVFISAAGELIVQAELSSMRCENLEITVEGRRLRISGDRPNAEFEAAETVLVHEISSGCFESVLELPEEYDLSHAKASYLNGVLRITVPRKDSPSPPTITLR